jgi:hypothetical protein
MGQTSRSSGEKQAEMLILSKVVGYAAMDIFGSITKKNCGSRLDLRLKRNK